MIVFYNMDRYKNRKSKLTTHRLTKAFLFFMDRMTGVLIVNKNNNVKFFDYLRCALIGAEFCFGNRLVKLCLMQKIFASKLLVRESYVHRDSILFIFLKIIFNCNTFVKFCHLVEILKLSYIDSKHNFFNFVRNVNVFHVKSVIS